MLVSHRYKFIYTKTRKTAGSSVESYFEAFCMPEGEWTQRHFREEYVSDAGIIGFRGKAANAGDAYWWNHMPAQMIRRRLGEHILEPVLQILRDPQPFREGDLGLLLLETSAVSETSATQIAAREVDRPGPTAVRELAGALTGPDGSLHFLHQGPVRARRRHPP